MRIFFVFGLLLLCFGVRAQEKVYVSAFKNKQLINAQTTVIPEGFEFNIMHRFGKIGIDDRLYKDFLGFDYPANIRFSLSYKLNERFYIGVGRTKIGKTIDFEGKYILLRQTADNSSPFSIAIFNNTGVNTEPYNDYGPNAFFSDSITLFENKFSHRVSYTTELILSKKFSDKLSLQLNPTMVYKNLVIGIEKDHFTFVLPFSGRFQYSFSSSILFEYAHKLNNRSKSALDNPFSLGFEFGTAGHVFQIFMSNSYYLREANIYTLEPYDFYQRPYEFVLGFNIRRVWWF
ncbi:MAG: hypothetical protein CMP70_01665 [Flavobacteriales bacterium]|nr:hypothetical protein [Flavobacteriales bacterium]|tara:strand:- start:8295 stop:9161 length:867 start_codon:yes stop_codon:yes gene_type:complete